MNFGIYIHIPYCLQRCRYCDFTTFEQDQILPPQLYVNHLLNEIRTRHQMVPYKNLYSLYFGGGTPSLLDPELIKKIVMEIKQVGFCLNDQTEVTIEINPATISPEKLEAYLDIGINRFSVGAQTFNNDHLKSCGRRHSADHTHETLVLLQKYKVEYSFDLLFALPHQTIAQLKADLEHVQHYRPDHLSAYCLTVPEGHPMSQNRPADKRQVEMFNLIEQELLKVDLEKYEISNFAQKNKWSRHNMLYWSQQAYWGVGVSAHSFFPRLGEFGTRFWNPNNLKTYLEQTELPSRISRDLPLEIERETLLKNESLTDIHHTFLRLSSGLPFALLNQWEKNIRDLAEFRINGLLKKGWLVKTDHSYVLSKSGEKLSNLVFQELTFLKEDLIGS